MLLSEVNRRRLGSAIGLSHPKLPVVPPRRWSSRPGRGFPPVPSPPV
ncbi:hypothetical protein M5D96_010643 [Drosophila gunungcola]|uniref:Uncharacterized protein n=1 Tax=Drosophila gunungcola TaxID=103775 RepID=A0A9Q0BL70_9MUSC|nr:hypothetical protein M5D96_010643 [Drosophila gunungcola]